MISADISVKLRAIFSAAAILSLLTCPLPAEDERLKWNKSWGPLVPHKKFSKDCGICHIPKRWDVLRKDFHFDHFKETGYPLLGAHAHAACLRCHNDRGAVATFSARGCAGCHVDPHKSAFGLDCAKCHNQSSWVQQGHQGEKIADHARTRFPLTGMHAALQCQQCHTRASAGDFRGISSDCFSCHQKDFQKAPNHVAMNFPHACQTCHNTASYSGATFNHGLLGANLVCFSCHQKDYTGAPNHAAQNYSKNCQSCHAGTTTWLGAAFDHTPLGPNPVCYTCHQSRYAAAKATPASNHASNGFPTTCQNCHNTTAWGPGTQMQHQFVGGSACYSCHQQNYQQAPNHVAQNFPQTCQSCHAGTTTWLGAAFDHTPLGPNPVCYTCHQSRYAAAKATPASNHTTNGFPTTCQNCHNTTAWGPGTQMQHQFVGGSGALCQTCHLADFNGALSPVNHTAQGIPPNSCNTCHTSFTTWTGFIHNPSNCYNSATNRSHHNATCTQCHSTGNYMAASCTACHSNRGNSCN